MIGCGYQRKRNEEIGVEIHRINVKGGSVNVCVASLHTSMFMKYKLVQLTGICLHLENMWLFSGISVTWFKINDDSY